MANALTKHRIELKKALGEVLTLQDAHLVENRYRAIRAALFKTYPNLLGGVDKEVMLGFLKDAVYLDRLLRKETEGEQPLKKKILSQEFQIGLGYKN